jgi:hypothetical protein
MSSKKKPATKREEITEAKNTTTLAKAGGVSIESAMAAISKLSIQTTGNLAKIGEDLLTAHNEYANLTEACKLKQEELTNLGLAVEEQLSFNEQKAAHQTELDRLAEEREEIALRNTELEAELAVTRERENDEFNYELSRKRKAENDAWTDQVQQRQLAERDRQELFTKDLKAREEVLAAKEAEYQAALTKLATFDETVKAEVTEAVGKATGSQKKDYEHKAQIVEIENKAVVSGLKKDLESSATALAASRAEAQSLRVELQKAYESMTGLANKTVEGANNKQAQADAMALITNIGSPNGSRQKSS